jgi:hypothetical protein
MCGEFTKEIFLNLLVDEIRANLVRILTGKQHKMA